MELGYSNIQGRAEVIRTLLAYFKFPYTEVASQGRKEAPALFAKYHFAFPNFPFLADGDVHITESQAIPIYLAHKANQPDFFGKAGLDHVHHQEIIGVLNDLIDGHFKIITAEDPQKENDSQKEKLDRKFTQLSTFLGTRDFLFDYITYADFYLAFVAWLQFKTAHALKAECLVCKHKNYYPFIQRIETLPGVKEYKESEAAKSRPIYNPKFTKLHFD